MSLYRNPTTASSSARSVVRPSGGLTLFEVMIMLAILGTLLALLLPAVLGRIDSGEAAALSDNFTQIRRAAVAYRNDVGRYPATLEQLSAKPGTGSVPVTDICNQTVPVAGRNAWRGPYIAQQATTGGIATGASRVNNTMERNPTNTAVQQEGYLRVVAVDVTQKIAEEVDRTFDGGTLDFAGGGITWSAAGDDTLRFHMAIRGC